MSLGDTRLHKTDEGALLISLPKAFDCSVLMIFPNLSGNNKNNYLQYQKQGVE